MPLHMVEGKMANMRADAVVVPDWKCDQSGELDALYACVAQSLKTAWEAGARTIAMPLLSASACHFPIDEAMMVESNAIKSFLADYECEVWLVVPDRESVRAGRTQFDRIENYIRDAYTEQSGSDVVLGVSIDKLQTAKMPQMRSAALIDDRRRLKRLSSLIRRRARKRRAIRDRSACQDFCVDAAGPFLDRIATRLDRLEDSFASKVKSLIDERKMTDAEVYKRANMSRQLFAKIRKDDGYHPSKRTACALAVALKLNLEDALMLLACAGYTLSHSSEFDVIVEYFLVNKKYDIFEINEALFYFNQPALG